MRLQTLVDLLFDVTSVLSFGILDGAKKFKALPADKSTDLISAFQDMLVQAKLKTPDKPVEKEMTNF